MFSNFTDLIKQDKRAMTKKANEKKKPVEAGPVKTRSSVTK